MTRTVFPTAIAFFIATACAAQAFTGPFPNAQWPTKDGKFVEICPAAGCNSDVVTRNAGS